MPDVALQPTSNSTRDSPTIHVCHRTNSAAGGNEDVSGERPLSKKPKGHWARDVSAYDILEPIGEGTYGKVRVVHLH